MSITKVLAKKLTNYDDQQSLGSRLRTKRIVPLLRLIEATSKQLGFVSIVDIGGTVRYWNIIPQQYLVEHNVKITIVNLPNATLPKNFGPFTFVHADGCNLSDFDNNSFHIAHSNSVIEHVGIGSEWFNFQLNLEELRKNTLFKHLIIGFQLNRTA